MGAAGLDPYAASTLLGAFAAETAGAAAGPGRGSRPDSSEWAPVATEAIEFPGPTATLMGAWAPAVRPKGAVLVIHENRGLTDHIRQVAGRFAASGFSALAIDLLSEEGAPPRSPARPRSSRRWLRSRPSASTPT